MIGGGSSSPHLATHAPISRTQRETREGASRAERAETNTLLAHTITPPSPHHTPLPPRAPREEPDPRYTVTVACPPPPFSPPVTHGSSSRTHGKHGAPYRSALPPSFRHYSLILSPFFSSFFPYHFYFTPAHRSPWRRSLFETSARFRRLFFNPAGNVYRVEADRRPSLSAATRQTDSDRHAPRWVPPSSSPLREPVSREDCC
ncbi:hypothetical protein UPYG_G00243740 [Umbra pygmaea]|uniref:Uncharacterized protein n=1 Tax=Umbra pygmaea TaxID=75934 RepID=A0ABD0WFV5_UMBPY